MATAEESRPSSRQALSLKLLGDKHLRNNNARVAIEKYQASIGRDVSLKAAYFNLAIAYYSCGRLSEAAKSLETLIRISPHDTEALYNLACLRLCLGNVDGAEEYFQKSYQCCEANSRFKLLSEDGISFIRQLRELDVPRREMLLLFFRQGVIPSE